ncbi:MAG: hypothetical protein IJF36_06100 [Oscillibacter sp.]|nr:hypothetical protein [Oscillibacter sp.]
MRKTAWIMAAALLLTGCAAGQAQPEERTDENEILIVVGGREVPAWQYLGWLERELTGLNAPPEDPEEVKARALADVVLYAAVEDMAAEYALAVSEQERQALTPGVWETLETAQWRQLAAVEALYGKLCTMALPEQELAAFWEEAGYRTVDRVLIPAGEGAAETAAVVFAQLNGGGEGAFTAAKEMWGDPDGPYTFCAGGGIVAPELEEAALTMEPGEISGILESEEGLSILYCLEPDLSEILIPWVDHCLLQRAAAMEIQTLQRYENIDVYAKFPEISGKNI